MAEGFMFSDLIKALIQRESVGDPMAVSEKGAIGLMQIRPEYAHDLYGQSAPSVFDAARERGFDVQNENVQTARNLLFDPDINMALGDPYLRDLFRAYGGNVDNALTAYNAGPIEMNSVLAAGKGPQDMGQQAREYSGHIRQLYRDATGMDLPETINLLQLNRPRQRPAGLLE
jgi:soluble lytic murein transglycosylase-like protein